MASEFSSWVRRQCAPVALGLAASLVAFALIGWLTGRGALLPLMLVDLRAPWSLLTYPWFFSPLASMFGLVILLVLVMWLIQFGGSLEREMGSLRFGAFWLVATLAFGLIAVVLGVSLGGPMLPGAALIVLWCSRNKRMSILLWGILPLSGVLLAALIAISTVFMYGAGNPFYGLAMAAPLALVWAFGIEKLPISVTGGPKLRKAKLTVVKGGTKYDDKYYESVKDREIERAEQERLRKLFEGK